MNHPTPEEEALSREWLEKDIDQGPQFSGTADEVDLINRMTYDIPRFMRTLTILD